MPTVWLEDAFAAGVWSMLEERLPMGAASPPSFATRRGSLGKLEQYKVNRFCAASEILAPYQRVDAILAFSRDQRAAEGILRPTDLNGALDTLAACDPSSLAEALLAVLTHETSDADSVRRVFERLSSRVRGRTLGPDDLPMVLLQAAFARTGPCPELQHLVESMTTDDQLRRRLQAAAFGFGNDSPLDLVNRLVTSARGLATPRLLNDVRDCTRMLTRAPIADALAGLARLRPLLGNVTDSASTNTHACLSVIEFMTALVLGYAMHDTVERDVRRPAHGVDGDFSESSRPIPRRS